MAQTSKSKRKQTGSERSLVDTKRPILTYLQGVLGSLNPVERQIAEQILADPERVITMAIAQFKDACRASAGSVVGFCRSLDLKGFGEFKIALARELAQGGLPSNGSQINSTISTSVFEFHSRSLAETLVANPETVFSDVANALQNASRIEFFSIGLSYPVAYTAASKLMLLGIPASSGYDSHLQLISASHLGRGDVAFGISLSGTTSETVQCLRIAKERGAKTICLTNAMKSPITECSDISLFATPSEIKYFQAPLASRVTQLAIIDILFVALATKNKDRTAAQLQRSSEELIRHRLTD